MCHVGYLSKSDFSPFVDLHFEQYDAIIAFCQKHMFLAGNMDQIERIDTLTVPIKAIREATLNLLVHRTWWSGARTPSVAIFDDRIEFMNPGSFLLAPRLRISASVRTQNPSTRSYPVSS